MCSSLTFALLGEGVIISGFTSISIKEIPTTTSLIISNGGILLLILRMEHTSTQVSSFDEGL